MPSIRAAALTDIGRVRQRNEDRYVLDLPSMIYGVADGVGGLPGDRLQLLTEDHSVENEARMRRARGETVYYHEANRNALTRCIGQPTPPEVDVIPCPLEAGQ